jgi:tetratricopeptide (TPR) repeat protein
MTTPTNRIFDSGVCLSLEEMQAYIDGSLKGADLNRVERHLLDCEMCEDALEGLKNSPNATANIDLIDEAIDRMTESKPKVIFPWKIAAAFALIFASTLTLWLVIPKNDENKLAEKSVDSNQQLINSDQSVVAEPTSPTSTSNSIPAQDQAQQNGNSSSAPAAGSPTPQVTTSRMAMEVSPNKNSREDVVADEVAEKTQGFAVSQEEALEPQMAPPVEISKKAKADNVKEEKVNVAEAEKFSSAKMYESAPAVTMAAKDVKANKIATDEFLNSGIKELEKGEYKKAEQIFISYLAMESPKRDQAYWYLSKIYIHQKDNSKAKKMLNAVIKENKSFVKEAQEALSKL